MNKEKSLPYLEVGKSGTVDKILCESSMRRRFFDIGLIPGTVVVCFGCSPFGDPKAYLVRGKVIAIRKEDAKKILLI